MRGKFAARFGGGAGGDKRFNEARALCAGSCASAEGECYGYATLQ